MATPDISSATPLRTCIGCRQRRPQSELVRCVVGGPRATISRTAPGRGAWLCSLECFRQAERRHAFDRAWKCKVSAEALSNLDRELHFALEGVVIIMEELQGTGGAAGAPAAEKG